MTVDSETMNCVLWIAARIVLVVFFGLGGILASVLVLKIYLKSFKQTSQSSQLYIVVMAWIDLLGCLVILPLTPFWERRVIPEAVFGSLSILQKQAYVFVQVAMTFDRVFAVFRPHQFAQMRRRTNTAIVIAFAAQQLIIQTCFLSHIMAVWPTVSE